MTEKLKSTSGASILIALLLLLMCAVAGSIVLTAATSSAGRLSSLKSSEKDYYAVSSAARLLKKEMEGEKYSRYTIRSEAGAAVETGYYEQPQKEMKNFLKKAADQVYDLGSYQKTWKIRVTGGTVNEVDATMNMDAEYNISIKLSSGNAVCILKVPAVIMEDEGTREDHILTGGGKGIRHTLTLMWMKGEITKQ